MTATTKARAAAALARYQAAKPATYAQTYNAMVIKLLPHHADGLTVDPSIDSESQIDEIIFRKSEYLGGMANAICAMINNGIKP